MTNSFIQNYLSEIKNVLLNNKIQKAYIFGSVCTKDFTDKSDIDIIIKFQEGLDPLLRGELWWNIYFSLEDLLKRPIDLLTEETLKNPYFKKEIEKTKQEII